MVPEFNEQGWLPGGIYECTLEEVGQRFGSFQISDRRPRLWAKFLEFIQEARRSSLIKAVLLDGSFISGRPDPNDIDLILVVPPNHDFSADLPLGHYNILNQKRVRRRFELDIVVVKYDSENLEWAIAFFQQVRQRPGFRKGILRISL